MAGLFAVVLFASPGDPNSAVAAERLLAHIKATRPAARWERVATAIAGSGAFAVIAAGREETADSPGMSPPAAPLPVPGSGLRDLGNAALAVAGGACALAVAGGPAAPLVERLLAEMLRGSCPATWRQTLLPFPHAALSFDGERLAMALDPLGAWPVYVRRLPGGLAIGTAALPLARLAPARDLDPAGVTELLAFGQLLGNRTLYADVEALPPGARVLATRAGIEVTRIELASAPAPRRAIGAAADSLLAALTAAVEQSLGPGETPGLLLSGGLDSRLLLALLAARSPLMTALTFGEPGSADEIYARRAATTAQVPHHVAPWTAGALARVLPHAVALTDGQVPAVHFHGTDILPALRRTATSEWNGFAGDAILGGSFAHPRYELPGPLPARLFATFNRILRPAELARVLAPAAVANLAGHPTAALAAALDRVPPGPAADRARRFLLAERVGRLAAAGLAIDRHYLPVVTPYAQEPALAAMAAMRLAEQRFGRALAHVLVRHFPRLAAIPWQRTGVPPGTPWPLAALNRKRLALGRRFGRPGGRPLADYAAWFDGPLAPLRRQLLLSPSLLERTLFSADALTRLVRAPVKTGRDAALAGTLVSLALAAEILDGKTNPPGELAPPGG